MDEGSGARSEHPMSWLYIPKTVERRGPSEAGMGPRGFWFLKHSLALGGKYLQEEWALGLQHPLQAPASK